MKKLLAVLAALAAWGLPAASLAARNPVSHDYKKVQRTLINNIALNAAAATRTFELTEQEVSGYGVAAVFVKFTRTAATDVQMDCTASNDFGTTDFTIQSCAVAAGVCTSTNANWTNAVAGNENWVWRIDMLGLPRVTCVFSGTAAGANDKVTVTTYVTAK